MKERIFTEEEYRRAIVRFLEICDAEPDSKDHYEAIEISKLMEEYENLSRWERKNIN